MRSWRRKFFASICLFAFMAGLMLGAVFKPKPEKVPELLQVRTLESALELCFSRLPRAAVPESPGMFVMLLAVAETAEQRGSLRLAGGQRAGWRLESRPGGMQLGVVGLQPLHGSWGALAGSECIRIDIAADDVD